MKFSVAELESTFAAALGSMRDALNSSGEPWMLIGGLAVGGWSEPRGTEDCDFALALPKDTQSLVAGLRNAGMTLPDDAFGAVADGGPVRFRFEPPDRPSLIVDLLCQGRRDATRAVPRADAPARARRSRRGSRLRSLLGGDRRGDRSRAGVD